MPADRPDLAARLAAATRADTIRGLAFNSAFDVVREHADEATVLVCDPSGGGTRPDFKKLPVSDFLQTLWAVGDRLERKLGGADEAFYQVGYRVTAGVLGSLVGHTLLAFGRSPRSLMTQVPTAYRAMVSYGQRFVVWDGERSCRIDFEHEFLPIAYLRGTVQAALDAAGCKAPRLVARVPAFMHAVIEVSWEA